MAKIFKEPSWRHRIALAALLASCLPLALPGCGRGGGSLSQADIKRMAIRRNSDADDESSKPAAARPAGQLGNVGGQLVPQPPAKWRGPAVSHAEVKAAQSSARPPEKPQPAPPVKNADAGPQPAEAETPTPSKKPHGPLSVVERQERTLRNLEAIGRAMEEYVRQNRQYPPPAIYSPGGLPLLSWRVELLPYLGHEALYKRFQLDQPWDSGKNKPLVAEIPAVYQSPERFDEKTNYLVPVGGSTAFPGRRGVTPRQFEDGVTNTVILLEVDDSLATPWTKPVDYEHRPVDPFAGLGALREDGFFVVWGGGLVARIPLSVSGPKISAMLSIDGGEPFSRTEVSCEATATPTVPIASPGAAATEAAAKADSTTPRKTKVAGQQQPALPAAELAVEGQASKQFELAAAEAAGDGREQDALLFLYAASLTSPQPAPLRWITGLKRPALVVRWGIGVHYVGEPRYERNLQPIGKSSSAIAYGSQHDWQRELVRYTGEFGERFLHELDARLELRGWGSSVLRTQPAGKPSSRKPLPARTTAAGEHQSAAKPIAPGIMFLGQRPRATLVKLAEKHGLDVTAIFEVRLKRVSNKRTRNGAIHNSTVLRLVDTATRAELYATHTLNNIQVRRVRENDPVSEDPVAETVNKLFAYIDKNLSMGEAAAAPDLEQARRRAESLTASEPGNPVPALAELKWARDVSVLSAEQLASAYQALVGPETARKLLRGASNEKAEVLAAWLPAGR